MRGSVIKERFYFWLVAKYGINALLYYDIAIIPVWIFDELYEDEIITDADLDGVDPKSVYALVFDHRKYLEVNVFPADIFLMFLRDSGHNEEIIGNKVFYLPPSKKFYYFEEEAYLLMREDFFKKISAPAE